MNSITVGNLKALLSLDTTNFDKGVTSSEANVKKLADRLSKDLAPSQARINSLIRDFAGNKDIARALEMATAVEKIGGSAKLTASEQGRANKVVQEAIEKYRALGIEAPKHLMDLANATKKVKKPTDDLGGSVTSLIGKANTLAAVFGVTLGAGALIGFAKSTFNAADQIGDLALKMGVSTDAAQRFGYAARQSGADIEDVSAAIVKMNDNLGTGDKGTIAALDAAGLRFEHIRSMKPEDAFREIADAIGRIPDPMTQARVAMDLFGKAGANLLPMIRENSLAVADGAEIMSADTIKALKDAQQAWDNFFGWLTVQSGTVIADIAKLWGNLGAIITGELGKIKVPKVTREPTFWEALTNPFGAAKMRFENSLAPFARMGEQVDASFASMPTIGRPSLFGQSSDDALAHAHAAANTVIDDHIKAKKAAEEHARAVAQLEEEYQSYARQRLTGMSDAERRRQVEEIRYLRERNLLQAFGWSLGLVGGNALSTIDAMTGGGISFGREMGAHTLGGYVPPIPSMALPMTPQKPRGPISLAELMAGANIPADRLRTLFGAGFSGAMGNLPQTILQAFTGGGNVGKSIGSLFGGQIGTSLMGSVNTKGIFESGFGKKIQGAFGGGKMGNMFGGALAGMMPGIASMGMSSLMSNGGGKGMMSNIGSYAAAGMMFGPWGAAVGAGIGAIVGAFKKGANNTKKAREEFAKELGFEGSNSLYDKLRTMGPEGARLVNTALNSIGKNDTAAQKKWMDDVRSFFDRLEKVPGKVNELSQALGKFGGAIPKQLDPLLDSILADRNLDPALRRQLEGMRKPSWQAAQEFANSVGINLGALGGGFNQSRLADQAFSLKRGIDLLGRFAGSDQNAILRDMADEFSALAQDAKKNNVALPRAVQAFIRSIDEMGLLLDENGDRLDSSLLQYADIEDEYEKQVVSLLEEIRDLLKPPTAPGDQPKPLPPGFIPRVPGTPPTPPLPPGGIVDPDFGFAGFAAMSMPDIGGTSGPFVDAGSGAFGFTSDPASAGMMTVIYQADGRELSRTVMPYVAGEVRRLGLAKA